MTKQQPDYKARLAELKKSLERELREKVAEVERSKPTAGPPKRLRLLQVETPRPGFWEAVGVIELEAEGANTQEAVEALVELAAPWTVQRIIKVQEPRPGVRVVTGTVQLDAVGESYDAAITALVTEAREYGNYSYKAQWYMERQVPPYKGRLPGRPRTW